MASSNATRSAPGAARPRLLRQAERDGRKRKMGKNDKNRREKKGAFKKLQLVHVGVNLVAQLDFNGGS